MLRIYQNIIRMFFMLVLCQSGMVVIPIITALMFLCFGFVSKAVLTVFGLLLSSACTASSLSLFPTLCPSVRGRKGSGWVCGCLAVVPGHPTRVQTVGSWVPASLCLRGLLPKSPLHLCCLCQRWSPCQPLKGTDLYEPVLMAAL